MATKKVKSCETCPFFRMDENWNCHCNADDSISMNRDEIENVHAKCPLKKEKIEVILYVDVPSVFLFHAKKPNFGFGEKITFNKDNYGLAARAFTEDSADMTNVDMILEWMFERTQNIESSWVKNKYKKGGSRIVPFPETGDQRSTSVGDVVIIRNEDSTTYWRCENVGWEEIDPIEYSCPGCGEDVFLNKSNCVCE